MTDLDLDAVQARTDALYAAQEACYGLPDNRELTWAVTSAAIDSAADVPMLQARIAELEDANHGTALALGEVAVLRDQAIAARDAAVEHARECGEHIRHLTDARDKLAEAVARHQRQAAAMQPIVDAAVDWRHLDARVVTVVEYLLRLAEAVDAYETCLASRTEASDA